MVTTKSLASTFHFNDDDLAANREGQLSAAQRRRLDASARAGWRGSVTLLVIVTILALILAASFLPRSRDAQATDFIPLIVILLGWLIYAVIALAALYRAFYPKTPILIRMTGSVVPGNRVGNSKKYRIEINGRGFSVSAAAHELIDPAKTYTLYTAVYSNTDGGTIVAIEEGDPTEAEGNKSPLEYENELLQRIFNFSAADLVANRGGQLSADQMARRSRDIRIRLGCGLLLALIVGIFLLVFMVQFTGNVPVTMALVGGLFLLAAWVIVLSIRRQRRTLENVKVQIVSGTADAHISQHRGRDRTYTRYSVEVAKMKFRLDENAYHAFKEGKPYNIYYSKDLYASDLPNLAILSAEQIG